MQADAPGMHQFNDPHGPVVQHAAESRRARGWANTEDRQVATALATVKLKEDRVAGFTVNPDLPLGTCWSAWPSSPRLDAGPFVCRWPSVTLSTAFRTSEDHPFGRRSDSTPFRQTSSHRGAIGNHTPCQVPTAKSGWNRHDGRPQSPFLLIPQRSLPVVPLTLALSGTCIFAVGLDRATGESLGERGETLSRFRRPAPTRRFRERPRKKSVDRPVTSRLVLRRDTHQRRRISNQ